MSSALTCLIKGTGHPEIDVTVPAADISRRAEQIAYTDTLRQDRPTNARAIPSLMQISIAGKAGA
jgi:hypothetical protein